MIYWLRFQIWRSLFWNIIYFIVIVYLWWIFVSFYLLELYHTVRRSFRTSWNMLFSRVIFRFVHKLQRWRNNESFRLAFIFFIDIFFRRIILQICVFISKTHERDVFIWILILNKVILIRWLIFIFILIDCFWAVAHVDRLMSTFMITAITRISRRLNHCYIWFDIFSGTELTFLIYLIYLIRWKLIILTLYRRGIRYMLILLERSFLN